MKNNNYTRTDRLLLIDIIRIICAFMIYARHSITMFGCTYGDVLNNVFIYLTSPVMTCFFMLSGFSIHYKHMQDEISSEWINSYLKKRIISIMPSYLLVVLMWPIAYHSQIVDWVILFPVSITGTQTMYRTLFGIIHNGGTWFVSCLLFSYLFYPVIQSVLHSNKVWISVVLICVIHFLLVYSNLLIIRFSLDGLYTNPLARCAEFSIGVIFANLLFTRKECNVDNKNNFVSILNKKTRYSQKKQNRNMEIILIIIKKSHCESVIYKKVFNRGSLYIILILLMESLIIGLFNSIDLKTLSKFFVIPFFLFLFYLSKYIRLSKLENNKIVLTMSGMSYQFYLVQMFLWPLTERIMNILNLDRNFYRIFLSLFLSMLLSYIWWRYIDKLFKYILNYIIFK